MKWEQYNKAVEPDFPGDTCHGVQFFEELIMKFVRAYRAKEEFLRCTDDRDAHMKCIEAYDIMIEKSVVCTEPDCEGCVVKNF